MKKKLLLSLLCVMAAVPVGMKAMEEGAQVSKRIDLSTEIEADINKKAKIIIVTIFNGSYIAACTMYHTSLANIKKDYSGEKQTDALTFFNQTIQNILTSVIPELIKNENDKALYAFKQIIDANRWANLQRMITDYIQNKSQFYTEYVDIDGVVVQAVQNNDLTTLIAYKENNPFMDSTNIQAIQNGIDTILQSNPALARQFAQSVPVMQPMSYLTRACNYIATHKKALLTAGLTLGALSLVYKIKSSIPVFSFWP